MPVIVVPVVRIIPVMMQALEVSLELAFITLNIIANPIHISPGVACGSPIMLPRAVIEAEF